MSARSMIIEKINKEFKALGQYFIDNVYPDVLPNERINFFDDYDLDKIRDLFGIYFGKFKNTDELLCELEKLLNDGHSGFMTYSHHGLFYIPMFIYLLKNGVMRKADFEELCMKIHLTKNKNDLFAGEGLRKLEVPFTMRYVDTLEMTLLAPKFSADLRTVIKLLDFIDYDRFINGRDDSLYSKYLDVAENDLFAYVSFFASDSLLDDYYNNRNKESRDYKYGKCTFNKAGIDLMSFYIDTNIYDYKNKFYQFLELEKRLKCSTDLESRKNNMMVAFTYRPYPNNDFYDCFSDVSLSMEDLVAFIKKYEDAGNVLSTRQVSNLLLSFRNRYLESNELCDEFESLIATVKAEFMEYRSKQYAFLPEEFIKYYNSKYPDNNFMCFNFGESSLLTRDIYEMIINNNILVGYNDLLNTNSLNGYIKDKQQQTLNAEDDTVNFHRKKEIYNKYYALLEEQHFLSEFTIDHFIRKNVLPEDMSDFLDLKKWFESQCTLGWDYSGRVKERTFKQIEMDFNEELWNNPFNKRHEILEKYNDYVINDGVSELSTPRYFYRPMHVYEREFIKANGLILFEKIMDAYKAGENLVPVLEELGLSYDDIRVVFGSMDIEFSSMVDELEKKAAEDLESIKKLHLQKEKDVQYQDTLALFKRFIDDKDVVSIRDFCKRNGMTVWDFDKVRTLLKEDEELQAIYNAKINAIKVNRETDSTGQVKGIVSELINGVKKSDGTVRPFTYLDFRLKTDMAIRQFMRVAVTEVGQLTELKNFCNQNQRLTDYDEKSILDEKYILMVDGKMHEVTREEKQAAVDFINDMGLPHEVKLYNLVVRASLNGELVLSKNDTGLKIYVKGNASEQQ